MVGRYTTQRWRRLNTQSVPSTAAMRVFQGRPLVTEAERAAARFIEMQVRREAEQAQVAEREKMLEVAAAVPVIIKQSDKRGVPYKGKKRVKTRPRRMAQRLRLTRTKRRRKARRAMSPKK